MEHNIVCGIDEAGRGPLWGPVTAAAVIFPPGVVIEGVKDSKKLSPTKRELLEQQILGSCYWGMGWASSQEIDQINILQASLVSMVRAWEDLINHFQSDLIETYMGSNTGSGDSLQLLLSNITILTDGSIAPQIKTMNVNAIVKGDGLIPEISAASILAKTARDRWVTEWVDSHDPQDRYGLRNHKGYPTSYHRKMIEVHGIHQLHRKTFNSARKLVGTTRSGRV
jgi:ribonuclease HII